MTSSDMRRTALQLRRAQAALEQILARPLISAAVRDHARVALTGVISSRSVVDRGSGDAPPRVARLKAPEGPPALRRLAGRARGALIDCSGNAAVEFSIVAGVLGVAFITAGTALAEPLTSFVSGLPTMISDAHAALEALCDAIIEADGTSTACEAG